VPTVADVLRQYGGEYLQRFGDTMPAEHRKVLRAITACRTGELGTVFYTCVSCGKTHAMGRSCGNRHCPTCQQEKARAWLERQTARLLPCPYFLVTFTLPAELRAFVRAHGRVCYAAMFEASSEALKTLAADPKHVGATLPGFFGVLHTWGRTLDYHPHVHYVVPGGGISEDGSHWKPARADFLVPVKALSMLYRAKFRAIMQREQLLDQIDPAVWHKEFVTDCRAVGDGRASLKYLAPYVFRVAISDQRIVSCDRGKVTFLYKKSGSRRWRTMIVDAMEFIRRFLQHVLPSGFQKVRHYGFLHPQCKMPIEAVRWLASLYYDLMFVLVCHVQVVGIQRPKLCCASCGGPLVATGFVSPDDVFPRGPPAGRWLS